MQPTEVMIYVYGTYCYIPGNRTLPYAFVGAVKDQEWRKISQAYDFVGMALDQCFVPVSIVSQCIIKITQECIPVWKVSVPLLT